MAALSQSGELPNLKIEIENLSDDAMDTDEPENKSESKHSSGETEEGEISDKDTEMEIQPCDDQPINPSFRDRRYENKGGGFVTGVDVFNEVEVKKLGERAKRFGLNPSEINVVTEKQLKNLYKSLGVKPEENIDKHIRLSALHMRGTEDMSTQDIFVYFQDYAPSSIEWINDYSCNVVWLDELSPARALLGLSKRIKGLDQIVRKEEGTSTSNTLSEGVDKSENDDVVVVDQIKSKDGQIIMVVDEVDSKHSSGEEPEDNTNPMSTDSDAVDASSITIPLPPGYWRKGHDYPRAKCILLRFATRNDKKLPHAEKKSDYYKKYGNPNYGGIKGLITSSHKRRFRLHDNPPKFFDDDQGEPEELELKDKEEANSKNPWGSLARTWSNIDKNRSKRIRDVRQTRRVSPPVSPPRIMSFHDSSRSIFKRIGRHQQDDESYEESDSSSDEDRGWNRRRKIPRMRMYADVEEIRIERLKLKARRRREPYDREVYRYEKRVADKDKPANYKYQEKKDSNKAKARSSEDLRSRLGKDSKPSYGIRSTVVSVPAKKQNFRKTSEWNEHDKSASESESSDSSAEIETSGRESPVKLKTEFSGADLRSKLNMKKSLRLGTCEQKSPLRIEIDNDEYYRVIASDQE